MDRLHPTLAARLADIRERLDHPPGVMLGILRLTILDGITGELEALVASAPDPDRPITDPELLAEIELPMRQDRQGSNRRVRAAGRTAVSSPAARRDPVPEVGFAHLAARDGADRLVGLVRSPGAGSHVWPLRSTNSTVAH